MIKNRIFRKQQVATAMQRLLAKQQWSSNLHFDFKITKHEFRLVAWRATDADLINNRTRMVLEAMRLFNQMKAALADPIIPEGISFGIYFYERGNLLPGLTYYIKAQLKDGEIDDTEGCYIEPDVIHYSDNEIAQLAMLRLFPLAQHQYLRFEKRKREPKDSGKISSALCLMNIVDSWPIDASQMAKESEQHFKDLNLYMVKGGPFKRIIIQYQHRCLAQTRKKFSFKMKPS